VLSQFCRKRQGNNVISPARYWRYCQLYAKITWFVLLVDTLTKKHRYVILTSLTLGLWEVVMPDEKFTRLSQAHALHPHPDAVTDSLFVSGLPFFDPRDLIQVKYEMLRRVRLAGDSVAQAADRFGLSRQTFYAAQAAWDRAGIVGLLPHPTGPHHGYKLTDDLVAFLIPFAATLSASQLAHLLEERFQVIVHPRSIERALARQGQKGGQ
jgi:transposase